MATKTEKKKTENAAKAQHDSRKRFREDGAFIPKGEDGPRPMPLAIMLTLIGKIVNEKNVDGFEAFRHPEINVSVEDIKTAYPTAKDTKARTFIVPRSLGNFVQNLDGHTDEQKLKIAEDFICSQKH